MATGRLAAVQTTAATNTTVYTVPTSKVASFTINICNTSDYDIVVQYLALSSTTSPTVSEYIEYNSLLGTGDILERTGLVLDASKNVMVKTSGPATVLVYGYEE